jgi:hypothetical protein
MADRLGVVAGNFKVTVGWSRDANLGLTCGGTFGWVRGGAPGMASCVFPVGVLVLAALQF